ncbi:MAG: hypothetical protein IJW48_05885 [Clostridia bacterium]|nr:hypothetical protein [Clostridia bacterium]MBQ7363958.1 hypothetical protein [Clostridia bacterium]
MRKSFWFLSALLILLTALALFSCGEPDSPPEATYRVMVSPTEGVSVVGENPREVAEGESTVFTVVLEDGYVYKSSEGGVYDPVAGTLTVENVSADVNIDFIAEAVTFNTKEKYYYIFKSDFAGDTTSVASGSEVSAGTTVKLSALDTTRVFVGWSASYKLPSGTLLSEERECEFMLTPELAKNGAVTVYANYLETNRIYYNANGGTVDGSTANITADDYYTATVSGSTVELILSEKYLSYFECASSFYDDGTFSRDGYVLTEYNTRADGTGVSYSLGSKVPLMTDGDTTTLYCIWSQAAPASSFAYSEITVPMPSGVTPERAPHWSESGLVITEYKGNDTTVAIPEKIGDKYVIAIAAGAFVNKDVETLVLSRRLLRVEDGAFVGCSKIKTVYYPDGLYSMNDGAFDAASYTSFKNFYVNATLAPRFNSSDVGALAVKLTRLLAPTEKNRIIVISGSSSLQGLGSEYLEALFDGEYRVVNFGTTRTTHGALYLEAMGSLAREGDIIVYAPENSAYMWGERELYWKTFRDLEGMNNIYRYVDFSSYTGMFSSMSSLNSEYRFIRDGITYESICAHGELLEKNPTYKTPTTNKYGDFLRSTRTGLSGSYHDVYYVTMNNRVKSRFEGEIYDDANQSANRDYTDLSNVTWCSVDDPYYKDNLNRAIAAAKSSGAKVYFGFCPVDADKLVEGASSLAYLEAYDSFIDGTFDFDGRIGSAYRYVLAHKYFYDCAFHPNDFGRVYRTYQLYLDISSVLGISETKNIKDAGTDFDGCLFEEGAERTPLTPWNIEP